MEVIQKNLVFMKILTMIIIKRLVWTGVYMPWCLSGCHFECPLAYNVGKPKGVWLMMLRSFHFLVARLEVLASSLSINPTTISLCSNLNKITNFLNFRSCLYGNFQTKLTLTENKLRWPFRLHYLCSFWMASKRIVGMQLDASYLLLCFVERANDLGFVKRYLIFDWILYIKLIYVNSHNLMKINKLIELSSPFSNLVRIYSLGLRPTKYCLHFYL